MSPGIEGRLETVVCLGKAVSWYGSRSGYYARLPEALRKVGLKVEQVVPRDGFLARAVGKLIAMARRYPSRNQAASLAEYVFDLLRQRHQPGCSVILSVEDHLAYGTFWARRKGRVPRNIIPVIHYPYELWRPEELQALARFQSALILYTSDIPRFEKHLGEGRLRAVLHGVDIAFFSPPREEQRHPDRVLFVGQFGRDYRTLVRVFNHLSGWRPRLEFHVLTGSWGYENPAWSELDPGVRVVRHSGLGDAALRELYQTCTLMVQPLEHCAANNAVVEGLACGIPIVASDVGGIRDYGGGQIFPVAPAGDPEAFNALAVELLSAPDKLADLSVQEREFAEMKLTWETSARSHIEAFRSLLEPSPDRSPSSLN
ncbi:MAG: glycosyltransferase [Verrucomicrobiia bacterium]